MKLKNKIEKRNTKVKTTTIIKIEDKLKAKTKLQQK